MAEPLIVSTPYYARRPSRTNESMLLPICQYIIVNALLTETATLCFASSIIRQIFMDNQIDDDIIRNDKI